MYLCVVCKTRRKGGGEVLWRGTISLYIIPCLFKPPISPVMTCPPPDPNKLLFCKHPRQTFETGNTGITLTANVRYLTGNNSRNTWHEIGKQSYIRTGCCFMLPVSSLRTSCSLCVLKFSLLVGVTAWPVNVRLVWYLWRNTGFDSG